MVGIARVEVPDRQAGDVDDDGSVEEREDERVTGPVCSVKS